MDILEKIDKYNIEDILSLTPVQEGILFHYLTQQESNLYIVQMSFNLSGEVIPDVLVRAWKLVTKRNEMLRTIFRWEKLSKPVQIVLKDHEVPISICDLSKENEKMVLLENIKNEDMEKKIDIRVAPLRVTICKLDEQYCHMILTFHHILYDGWSNGIILKELADMYRILYKGTVPMSLPPKSKYKEYIKWHQNQDTGGRKSYWKDYLRGYSTKVSLSGEAKKRGAGAGSARYTHIIAHDLTKKIDDFVKEHELTATVLFYTAWGILFEHYGNSDDVVFGTTISDRPPAIKDISEMVGLFINTVPLRIKTEPGKRIIDLLLDVNRVLLERRDFESTPLVDIMECSELKGQGELFDSIIIVENYPLDKALCGNDNIINIKLDSVLELTNYDLTLEVTAFEGMKLNICYNDGFFSYDAIKSIADHFIHILYEITQEPLKKISEIRMLSDDEYRMLLYEFNSTEVHYDKEKTIHGLFEMQVEKTPDKEALLFENKSITYRELSHRSDQIAGVLRGYGVGEGSIIGLLVDRSLEMITGILGILKSGAAYLPLDPDYPEARIEYMLKDSGACILLTKRETADKVKFHGKVVYFDAGEYSHSAGNAVSMGNSCSLAYVIYTSGSTGKPKGVMIEHKAVNNFIQGITGRIEFSSDSRILSLTTISFDIFVLETLLPLVKGLTVAIGSKDEQRDPALLAKAVLQNKIDMLQITPSRLQLILNSGVDLSFFKRLKTIMVGGEAFPNALLEKLSSITKSKIFNLYGPTETTVWSTMKELTGSDEVNIGKPIANTRIYILNSNNTPQPVGVPGELCIAGDGLSRGYLNKPELTAEKFVADPFKPEEKMYRTGDLAKWLGSGEIECLGRVDHQVKIRGYRIELSEIECKLLDHSSVNEAAVIVKKDIDGNGYLCAYIVTEDGFDLGELKEYLLRELPEYMVPSFFIKLESIPLTQNGKIDRSLLPEQETRLFTDSEYSVPVSDVEKVLYDIWKQVLAIDRIGVNDRFFDVGGNSILLTRLHARIDSVYPGKLAVTDLFTHTTISKQAKAIEGGENPMAPEVERAYPLSDHEAYNQKIISGKVSKKDVAIIGIAVKLPMAEDLEQFLYNMRNGVDCIREFPSGRRADTDAYYRYVYHKKYDAGYFQGAYLDEIDKFDYSFFRLTPNEANLMDPKQRLFLQVAWQAMEDAGYGGKSLKGSKTGVYVGYSSDDIYEYKRLVMDVDPDSMEAALPGNVASIIASRLSYLLDLKGPSMLIDTACSSSLVAVHLACRGLETGDCEMALAGGVKLNLIPAKNRSRFAIESGDGRTRTFDDSSDGTGWGEGVAAILLKPLSKALEDRDHIYAVIKGSAINQDGSSIGITAPNADAQADVITSAWEDAGINPERVSYIEAHGTGTKLGDPIEIEGVEKAFMRYTGRKQFCAIGSLKTNIGHLDNAAGMVGLIKTVLGLKQKELFPTLHFSMPSKKIIFEDSPVYVNDVLKKWEREDGRRLCGISSFGLSGTNCHVVLEEFPDREKKVSRQERVKLLALSAKSRESLKELVPKYISLLNKVHEQELEDICYTANTGRGHYNYRLAVIFHRREELAEKLKHLSSNDLDCTALEETYYKEHKIVPSAKLEKEYGDLTEEEKRKISTKAYKSLKEFLEKGKKNAELLRDIGLLYVKGAEIDWHGMYKGENLYRVSIPYYAFEKKRCWIRVPEIAESGAYGTDNIFSTIHWENKELQKFNSGSPPGGILVIADESRRYTGLIEGLRQEERNIIMAAAGDDFKKAGSGQYSIRCMEEDYVKLFESCKENHITRIVYLLAFKEYKVEEDVEKEGQPIIKGVMSLFSMVRALARTLNEKIEIFLISEYAEEVTAQQEKVIPENAAVFGLARTIGWEYPDMVCRCVDIDEWADAACIVSEIQSENQGRYVAYRKGKRYVPVLEQLDTRTVSRKEIRIRNEGVYVITGGTGAVGLEIGRYLSSKNKVNIALLSRSKLPEAGIDGSRPDEKLEKRLRAVKAIEASGARVEHYSVDISRMKEVDAVLKELRSKYGRINGIIHCAGIGDGGLINLEKEEKFTSVMEPKVRGTWILDYLSRQDDLDFFVLFSSTITLVGGIGAGAYTAANSYMDSFAAYRSRLGKRTLVINWPAWKDTGMSEGMTDHGDKHLFEMLLPEEAANVFGEALNMDMSRIIAGKLNLGCSLLSNADRLPFEISPDAVGSVSHKTSIDRKTIGKDEPHKSLRLKGRESFTATEQKVAGIWRGILGHDEINIYDDFYALGGDSLIGARIINKISSEFNCAFDTVDFFKNLTIKDLAGCLDTKYLQQQRESKIHLPIDIVEEREYYPLSSAQKRLFILEQMKKSPDTSYNIPGVYTVEGFVDVERLDAAFRRLVERHEALRTSFEIVDGIPVQKINKIQNFKVNYSKAVGRSLDEMVEGFVKPFDLSQAPLLRVELVELQSDRHVLLFDTHHIVADGVSIGILVRDFAAIYEGREIPEINVQYKDFAEWQDKLFNEEFVKKQEAYWLQTYDGEIPILNLPLDNPRPAVQSFKGARVYFEIDGGLYHSLKEYAVKTGTTLYMLLLAAYNVLLFRYTGQEHIIIGSPTAGRRHADLENVVGMFVNTLAMSNRLQGEKAFKEFLSEVKENALQAYENQDYQFEALVDKLDIKRDLSRNPLFDTMFALQNIHDQEVESGTLKFVTHRFENRISKFDITLQAFEKEKEMDFYIEYCTDIFKEDTIRRMAVHFENILRVVSAGAGVKISMIDMMSAEERSRLLFEFNQTCTKYPINTAIHRLFEEQVEKTPDKIAVVFGNESLTYRELNEKANKLARLLVEKGVKSDDIVGILVKRSPDMMTGILGVLKSGGAYLPIDPQYPEERIKYMLEDSGADVLLVQGTLSDSVSFKGEKINVDRVPDRFDGTNLEERCASGHLAYVIYTSGSTGKPKGVMIEHRAVGNFIKGVTGVIDFSPDCTILCLTTISFDIFVLETLLPLSRGLKVVIASEEQQINSQLLGEAIIKNGIDLLQMTPSRMRLLMSGTDISTCLKNVKAIMIGGEAFPENLLKELQGLTKARIYNMYGPTETTVWSTIGELTKADKVEIGKPIANTRIYIVDDGRLVHAGGIGELCIAGDGLSRGYINRPELNEEKFVPDPYSPGQRMYKTGDMARWLNDGKIELFGRIDSQVKIRGYRIELGEIEKHLMVHDEINDCVVLLSGDQPEEKFLTAYYVAEREIPVSEIRTRLAGGLPDYMIPQVYVHLVKLPVLPNGKIDKKALPEPGTSRPKINTEYSAPETEVERTLVHIWQEVLNRELIGINDNFFELGGNSLLLVKMHSMVGRHYPGKLNVGEVFAYPTISSLAKFIKESTLKTELQIPVVPVEFPSEYFIEGDYHIDDRVLKYQASSALYEELKALSAEKDVFSGDILLSIFIYLLYEITEMEKISLHYMKEDGKKVVPLSIDLLGADDFDTLLDIVKASCRKEAEKACWLQEERGWSIIDKDRKSVSTLFTHVELDCSLRAYDIILMACEDMNRLNIICQFNAGRIKEKKIEELIFLYIKAIRLVLDKISERNEG